MRTIIKADHDQEVMITLTLTDDLLDNPNYVDLLVTRKNTTDNTFEETELTVSIDELYRAAEAFKGLQKDRL